ncbi:MAG TPA: signal peptidase I [Thermoanaerobaculia bacterium]|jgi:signal peptidase I
MSKSRQPKAAPEEPEAPKQSSAREWYESLLVAGVFVLFVRTFVVQTYQVPTGSMEKTILIGDHFLVNKFAFAPRLPALAKLLPYREVQRNDIIIFKKPVAPYEVLVKRAVAVGGDVVEVRDKVLYVNGAAADGPWARHTHPGVVEPRRDAFGPFTIPPGHYWGMGDNRDNSFDSRYWGPIPPDHVFGRLSIIYWSFEAEPDSHLWRGPLAKLRQMLDVLLHFFSRTRWDRMFTLVR